MNLLSAIVGLVTRYSALIGPRLAWLIVATMSVSAWAYTPQSPPADESYCSPDVNVFPWASGSQKATAGYWVDGHRGATSWDLLWSDDHAQVKVILYTYDTLGRPTWRATKMTTIPIGQSTWTGSLYKYTSSNTNPTVAVGSIAIRFFADDPTKLAMNWDWDDIDGTGLPGPQHECLHDFIAVSPTSLNSLPTPPTSPEPAGVAYAGVRVNEIFSGYSNLSGSADLVPGLSLHILQPTFPSCNPTCATPGIFVEHDAILTWDDSGQPMWLVASMPTPACSAMPCTPPPLNNPGGALLYFQPNPAIYTTHGFPYFQDCTPEQDCLLVGQTIGSVTRNIQATNLQTLALSVTGVVNPADNYSQPPNPQRVVGGTGLAFWPSPTNPTQTLHKITDNNGIMPVQYVCQTNGSGPTATCTSGIWIAWSWGTTGTGPDLAWRHDLNTGTYTPLSMTSSSNEAIDPLHAGDRVQYEMWNGNPPGGQRDDYTAEVRGYGPPQGGTAPPILPDAPIVHNSGDLLAHDPTVGTAPGEAGVEGGASTYQIPIPVPPGRNGMQPDLALTYNSRAGNGVAGLGWSLSGASSIHRCPQTVAQDGHSRAVRMDASDRLCLDGQRLMVTGAGTYGTTNAIYRTEVDSFVQVKESGSIGSSNTTFTVQQKNGRTLLYGGANAHCTSDATWAVVPPGQGSVALSWLLQQVTDPTGNRMDYCYAAGAAGEVLLQTIYYTGSASATGTRQIRFNYGVRPSAGGGNDWSSSYIGGVQVVQSQRLTSIETWANGTRARQYKLTYMDDLTGDDFTMHSGRSALQKFEECDGVGQICKDATLMTWADAPPDHIFGPLTLTGIPDVPPGDLTYLRHIFVIGDLDGDGAREVLVSERISGQMHAYLAKYDADRNTEGTPVDLTSLYASGLAAPDDDYTADIDGDGRADGLEGFPTTSSYLNLLTWKLARGAPLPGGSCPSPTCPFYVVPTNVPLVRNATQNDLLVGAEDVDGDGYQDILVVRYGGVCADGGGGGSPALCVYLNNVTRAVIGGTTTNYNFSTVATAFPIPPGYGYFRRADLNGDGIPDIVLVWGGCGGLTCDAAHPPVVLLSANAGSTGVAACPGSGYFVSCSAQNLGLAVGQAYTFDASGNAPFLIDINGDGLADIVYGSIGGCSSGGSQDPKQVESIGSWCAQVNTGHGFSPITNMTNGSDVGSNVALSVDGNNHFSYLGRFPIADVDGDGRPEILYPSKLASRICRLEHVQFPDGTGCRALQPNNVTCDYWVCPEDPDRSNPYALPTEGSPPQINLPEAPMYGGVLTGLGRQTFDLDDNNAYVLGAVRFVQTGNSTYSAVSYSLDATQGIPSRSAHVGVGAPGELTQNQDLYGDGLPDLTSWPGCRALNTSDCVTLHDGVYGPSTLPDGTPITDTSMQRPKQYISENVGFSDRPGFAPYPPELLSRVDNGLGDYASWDYYVLGSSAPRDTDTPPFYAITSPNYVDKEYYYFTSSMPAVASMLQNNVSGSILGARSFAYGYEDAIYDHFGRGFQGFRKTHQVQIPPGGQPKLQVSTTYHQKFPLSGKPLEVDVGLPVAGAPMNAISTQANTWRCAANGAAPTRTVQCPGDGGTAISGAFYFPYLDASIGKTFDLAAAGQSLSQQVTEVDTYNADTAAPSGGASGWDVYGNLIKQYRVRKDIATNFPDGAFVSGQTSYTNNVYYAADTNNWWIDKLNYGEVTTSVAYNASGFSPARTLPTGADPGNRTVRTTPTWNTDRTLQQKVTQDMASGGQQMTVAYTYPAPSYGIPTISTVSATGLGSSRQTQFGLSSDGYFVQTTTNAAGHTTTTLVRPEDGQVSQVTDPNGLVTKMDFDTLGVTTGIDYFKTDGSTLLKPSIDIAVTPCTGSTCTGTGETFAKYKVTTVQDGAPTQVDWFDPLNRQVKHAERGFDGTWIWSLKTIDSLGNVTATTAPYFQSNASYTTTLVYDALHRLIKKTQPTAELNGTQGNLYTYYTYAGNRTDISVRAANQPQPPTACSGGTNLCVTMARYTSVIGDLMRSIDAQNGTTDFWYDGAGHTIGILDANRTPTAATYTALGYRTVLKDPNQGTWTFAYNGLGELVTQTDARLMVTTVTNRDPIGRIVQETAVPPTTVPAGMDGQAILDTWTWDPSGTTGGKGLLGALTRARGATLATVSQVWNETYVYDATTKRLKTRTTTIEGDTPGASFLTQYQYDNYYGREKSITFPSNFTLWKQYGADNQSDYGDLSSLLDGDTLSPLWSLNQANEYRQPLQEQFGYAISGVATYAHSTGQNFGETWTFSNGNWVDQTGYQYDVLGNLTQRSRKPSAGVSASIESYAYDTLQRLGTATKVTQGNASVTYLYDAVGNLKEKTDYSAASASAYAYGGSGCPGKPNFVTSVALPSSGSDTYTCDANGNIIGGSQFNSTLTTYDADNLPTKIVRASGPGAQFNYDPMNRRYHEALTSSFFVGDGYERIGNGTNATHRHELGPVVVITNNGANNPDPKHFYYSLRDRLGSTVAVADDRDPQPGSVTHRDYDAYGRVRDPQIFQFLPGGLGLGPTTIHGFTNQEHVDNVALIHMGGRMYDYTLGRFLSVDPVIQDKANSQSLNPYSYIGNNPLSGKDPTGYQSCSTGTHITGDSGPSCEGIGVSVTQVGSPSVSAMKAAAAASPGNGHQNQPTPVVPENAQDATASSNTGTMNNPATPTKPQAADDGGLRTDLTDSVTVRPDQNWVESRDVSWNIYGAEKLAYKDWLDRLPNAVGNDMIRGFYDFQLQMVLSQFSGDAPGGGLVGGAGVVRTAGGMAEEGGQGFRSFAPGPYAGESIVARSAARDFTTAERAEINRIGQTTGCHTCGTTNAGTKSGNFVPDHQPVSSLNLQNAAQRLYPHCINCSREQGLDAARQIRDQQP